MQWKIQRNHKQFFKSKKKANLFGGLCILFPFLQRLGIYYFHRQARKNLTMPIIYKIIDERMNRNDSKNDLLQHFVDLCKAKKMSRFQLFLELELYFAAATDTTAVTTTFTILNLLLNPECLKKVQLEVDSVLGKDELATSENLSEMPYLLACIRETLRKYPPDPSGPVRTTTKDLKLHGFEIPSGTTCHLAMWSILNDPKVWDQPEKYDPERFLKDEKLPTSFMPFSVGPRNCIGQYTAMYELQIILSMIIRNYTWNFSSSSEKKEIETEWNFLLYPKGDVPLVFQVRN